MPKSGIPPHIQLGVLTAGIFHPRYQSLAFCLSLSILIITCPDPGILLTFSISSSLLLAALETHKELRQMVGGRRAPAVPTVPILAFSGLTLPDEGWWYLFPFWKFRDQYCTKWVGGTHAYPCSFGGPKVPNGWSYMS